MIKFNDNNIYVGQIKQLLCSFNLPQCRVFTPGMNLESFKEGDCYIKDNALYSVYRKYKLDEKGNLIRDSYGRYEKEKNLTHKYLGNYKLGDKIENLTKNLDLRNNIYDSYTHQYLGNYLRFIRDLKGLDLMSLYNCCSYEVPAYMNINFKHMVVSRKDAISGTTWSLNSGTAISSNTADFSNTSAVEINQVSGDEYALNITGDEEDITIEDVNFNSKSIDYDIIMASVRFGQKYTIAIDWSGSIEMFCGFYRDGYIQSSIYEEGEIEGKTYFKSSENRFRHPFLFNKLENIEIPDYQQEENLKLFIKIPKNCDSSVVVLEGDYLKDTELINGVSGQYFAEDRSLSNEMSPANYQTKHQLISINNKEKNLLADRMLEYLSENAVTNMETISDNIKRLQYKLDKELEYEDTYKYYGIWDDEMKKAMFDFANTQSALKMVGDRAYSIQSTKEDLLYYLDKDIESAMGGLPYNITDVEWTLNKGGK